MAPTNLHLPASELPDGWSVREQNGGGAVYAHANLAARVALRRADDGTYRVLADDGERRRRLRPPDAPTDPDEAVDWAVALMRQVDRQCGPDRRDPVAAALRRVRGETSPAADPGTDRDSGDRTCLLRGATLAPFRGEDTAARFASHVRYADDATHADAARYLADPTAYVSESGDARQSTPGE